MKKMVTGSRTRHRKTILHEKQNHQETCVDRTGRPSNHDSDGRFKGQDRMDVGQALVPLMREGLALVGTDIRPSYTLC